MKSIKVGVKTITPEIAAAWLKKNTKNRRVNKSAVQRIAEDIRSGRWAVNGQAIVFDANGVLVDGQHRLHAIVASGLAIESVVVWGVDPAAFVTIDQGAGSRTFAHVCTINGEKNAPLLAAITAHAWRYEQGKALSSIKGSTTDLELFLEDHPELKVSAEVGRLCGKIGQGSVLGFCHYAFSKVSKKKANEFFSSLESGANLTARSPVLHLRDRLISAKADKHTRLNPPAQIYLTFRAWVAFRDGKEMRKLQLPKDGNLSLPTLGSKR